MEQQSDNRSDLSLPKRPSEVYVQLSTVDLSHRYHAGEDGMEDGRHRSLYYHPIPTQEEMNALFSVIRRSSERESKDCSVETLLRETDLVELIAARNDVHERARWVWVLLTNEGVKGVIAACHQRWVANFAARCQNIPVDWDSRYAAANEGLARAINLFKPELGYKFSTYSQYCMLDAVQREAASTYGVPIRTWRELAKVRYIGRGFYELFGRQPDRNELERLLLANADGNEGRPEVPFKGIRDLAELYTSTLLQPASFDEDLSDDGHFTYQDTFSAADTESPEIEVEQRFVSTSIMGVVRTLDTRAAGLVTALFGLSAQPPQSIEVAAVRMGLTTEAAELLLGDALRAMRQMPIIQELAEAEGIIETSYSARRRSPSASPRDIQTVPLSSQNNPGHDEAIAVTDEELTKKLQGANTTLTRIARLAIEGKSTTQIRDVLGISKQAVHIYSKELFSRGLPRPKSARQAYLESNRTAIQALANEGKSVSAIARELELGQETVRACIHVEKVSKRQCEQLRENAQSVMTQQVRQWMVDHPMSKRPYIINVLRSTVDRS